MIPGIIHKEVFKQKMKRNNQYFGALSRTLCCICAIVLCMGCLSSGTYGWYTETASASGVIQFGQWNSPPENLISNGDFSEGLTGWKSNNAASNIIEVTDGYLKLQRSETGNAPNVSMKITDKTFPAGTYTLSGKVLVSGEEGCATPEIEISFKNAGGTVINQPKKLTLKNDLKPAAMTWTDFSLDVVIPQGETATELGITLKYTLTRVGYIYYDDISVMEKQS